MKSWIACLRMTPNQKLFMIARELEQVALNDDYFKERNLYPNVDSPMG